MEKDGERVKEENRNRKKQNERCRDASGKEIPFPNKWIEEEIYNLIQLQVSIGCEYIYQNAEIMCNLLRHHFSQTLFNNLRLLYNSGKTRKLLDVDDLTHSKLSRRYN